MKKIFKLFGFAAIAAIGFTSLSLTGCPDGTASGDTTAPTVVNVAPNGTDAAVSGNVVITFNEAMNTAPGTVKLNTAALSGGAWSSGNTVFTIPYSGLALSTSYTVHISGFKDAAGNVMAANSANSFTTGSTPDTSAPTVVSVTPSGTDAAVNGNVVITFSEAMDTAAGTVELNDDTLPGGAWSVGNTVFTIPYDGLALGAAYTVAISGFKDVAGNTMAPNSSYSFTVIDLEAGLYAKAPPIAATDTPVDLSATAGANIVVKSVTHINANVGTYTLLLDGDVSCDPQTLNAGARTLTLIGMDSNRTVTLTSNGRLFTVQSGVTLTLDDKVTLRGKDANNGSLVMVNSGGMLEMKEGSAITGNAFNAADSGGGVHVASGGTFTMSGGEIKGNSDNAANSCGGVYVASGGTFAMSGGEIKENESKVTGSYGGGVCINGGTFTMTGGTVGGNAAYTGGGGVFILNSAVFTMSGGSISGNTARNSGAGLYMSNSAIIMSGGSIAGNEAGENAGFGGGVYVGGNGTFTMIGGEIKNNIVKATDNTNFGFGGGVYVYLGTFAMYSGTISGNTAAASGGGVNVLTTAAFTMSGGNITGNTAAVNGGGVMVSGGTFTLNSPAVQANISGNFAPAGTANQAAVDSGTINGSAGMTAGW